MRDTKHFSCIGQSKKIITVSRHNNKDINVFCKPFNVLMINIIR